jgi:hypothetical protein
MSTALEPVSEAIFNNAVLSFAVLTTTRRYRPLFRGRPRHALSIPSDYKDNWAAEWTIEPLDFMARPLALSLAAKQNRKALADADHGDGEADEWTLVFRLGGWLPGSYMFLPDGCGECNLNIKTTLTIVRPTREEITRFAGVGLAEKK